MSKIRIRKRGNTYSYSFDISKNPRRMKEKGGFATEDEAFDAGVKAYTDWKSGNIGITSERVKLRDYLASWLENVVRPNVKRTTFKSYHNAIGSRITPEQFAAIPESNKYYPLLKILYHTGLRISEALGLTWDDIDLETGAVSISRQRIQAGYFDTPKTETSARTFYADALLLSYLRALKKEQTKDELRFGQAYQIAYESKDADRVFILLPKRLSPAIPAERRPLLCVHPTGIPYAHENVRYALYRLGLNSHSFRHTHATRLIESGAKPVDVAARLGHADATITQNLYAHDTDDMQQETARIFECFVDNGCM